MTITSLHISRRPATPLSRRSLVLATLAMSVAPAFAAAPPASAPAGGYKEIPWEDLIPKDWDPLKQFRGINMGAINDGSPRMLELMRQMRTVWNNAPTNAQLDGAAVKLPGYVVPLEEVRGALKEFLLVPYFGACIHTPPPPANQIVHVRVANPVKGLRMMDAVWASGTLSTVRVDSMMGTSGYQMKAVEVVPYVPNTKP
jgi:hypothetical protein